MQAEYFEAEALFSRKPAKPVSSRFLQNINKTAVFQKNCFKTELLQIPVIQNSFLFILLFQLQIYFYRRGKNI